MRISVKMLAFDFDGKAPIRRVDIGGDIYKETTVDEILNRTFHFGQNDFQPQDMPSVSMGDVVLYEHKYYRVAMCGFEELSFDEYHMYLAADYSSRLFWKKGK